MTGADTTGFGVARLGDALLEDPVAFLSAEHARQMALLAHLDRLARAPGARGARVMATALLRWITEELPLHIADEEQSLYPRLRRHGQDASLVRLSAEHRRDAFFMPAVTRGLRAIAAGTVADYEFLDAATGFARLHRQHLDHEEATIMPLARAVLAREEAEALAAEMAVRRGMGATCRTAS